MNVEETRSSEAADMPPPAAPVAAGSGEILVEVRDLAKHFGAIRAVDGISFTVRRGDVLGFLGPNGAGKTTAMKMITGFLEPDRGGVRIAGHDVAVDSLAARRKLGYLPENAPAYGEMTPAGFLGFVASARRQDAPRRAVERAIAMTGLEGVAHQTIDTLSKGFKRRVGLAQALLHDPEVLILDEPTDGLDPNQKVLVHRLIDELAPGKAIILSTHVLAEVERICTRAMIISRGRILIDSTPAELIARAPGHNAVHVDLAAPAPGELMDRLRAQPWCETVERRGERGLEVRPRTGENRLAEILGCLQGTVVERVEQQEGRLEDLFREVTEGVSS